MIRRTPKPRSFAASTRQLRQTRTLLPVALAGVLGVPFLPALAREQSRFAGNYTGTWYTHAAGPGVNTGDFRMSLSVDDTGKATGAVDFTGCGGVCHYDLSGHITDDGAAKFTANYVNGKQTLDLTGQFDASSKSLTGNYTVYVDSYAQQGDWKTGRVKPEAPEATATMVPEATAKPAGLD